MDKRTRERMQRQASVLPSLPETAGVLATELHQRADAMLRVRLENIEVHVNTIVDQVVNEIIQHAVTSAVQSRIRALAEARIDQVLAAGIDRALPEVVASQEMADWTLVQLKQITKGAIESLISRRVNIIGPAIAEKLVRDALVELQKYYGATRLLEETSEQGTQ